MSHVVGGAGIHELKFKYCNMCVCVLHFAEFAFALCVYESMEVGASEGMLKESIGLRRNSIIYYIFAEILYLYGWECVYYDKNVE